MWTISLILALLAGSLPAAGAENPPVSLAELASRSDAVVLAQVRDTDYLRRRDIPVSGSAYLKVLIAYKLDRQEDLIEIYEKGLHERECYFRDRTVFEEGRRYLLFLRRDPEDNERYRGMPEGCALEILVDDNNRYALRYPARGISLSDDLDEVSRAMTFSDAYAVVNEEDVLPERRDAMLSAGYLRPYQPGSYIYTTGVELAEVRRLMGDALLH